MLFLGQREIQSQEYHRNSVILPRAPLIPVNGVTPLQFRGWRLAIAMARTIASRHLDRIEYYSDIFSAYLGLLNIVHPNVPNIRLSSNRLDMLRDFSRTSRIGELGQAIVWLYLMENNYPFINDFRFFCHHNNIAIPPNSSTPDFIAQTAAISIDICLVEAKGKETLATTSIKSKLRKGLQQCDAGELLLAGSAFNVQKKLAFCTEFSDENNGLDSTLSYSDPKLNANSKVRNDLPMRLHYASWFYIIGDFKNVNNLVKGEKINLNEKMYNREHFNNTTYWTISPYNSFLLENLSSINKDNGVFSFFPIFLTETKMKLAISEGVISRLQKLDDSILFNFGNESSESQELFSDGTAIFKSR